MGAERYAEIPLIQRERAHRRERCRTFTALFGECSGLGPPGPATQGADDSKPPRLSDEHRSHRRTAANPPNPRAGPSAWPPHPGRHGLACPQPARLPHQSTALMRKHPYSTQCRRAAGVEYAEAWCTLASTLALAVSMTLQQQVTMPTDARQQAMPSGDLRRVWPTQPVGDRFVYPLGGQGNRVVVQRHDS